MNRSEIIEKLIKEGFSEKTLVKFNDNQLKKFSEKMLKEAQTVTTTKTVYTASDPRDKAAVNALLDKAAHDPSTLKDKNIEVKEGDEMPVSKIKSIAKAKQKTKSVFKNINEFVNNAVDKKYHSMTTKNEMVELIKSKLNMVVSEDLLEKTMSKLPEFLSFDAIVSAGQPETAPSPSTPETIPDTPTREDDPKKDPRRSPFRNPNEEPAADPAPKAKIKQLHRNKMSMAAE
jgi:hypothetical protein